MTTWPEARHRACQVPGSSPTNDSRQEVGGMVLPFAIHVARVYEAAFDIPVVRRRGGRVFTR